MLLNVRRLWRGFAVWIPLHTNCSGDCLHRDIVGSTSGVPPPLHTNCSGYCLRRDIVSSTSRFYKQILQADSVAVWIPLHANCSGYFLCQDIVGSSAECLLHELRNHSRKRPVLSDLLGHLLVGFLSLRSLGQFSRFSKWVIRQFSHLFPDVHCSQQESWSQNCVYRGPD